MNKRYWYVHRWSKDKDDETQWQSYDTEQEASAEVERLNGIHGYRRYVVASYHWN